MEKSNKNLAVIIVALLVIVGGVIWATNRNDSKDTATKEAKNTSQQSSSTSEDKSTPNIVALASNTQSLTTLVSAVKAASLVETLQGNGPFTVLAPTNDAFSALPAGTLDTLLKPENVDQLKSILTYHVISGKVMAADLKDGQEVSTIQGGKLIVKISDSKVYFVDTKGAQAQVTQADITASNGVVHVINSVLMP